MEGEQRGEGNREERGKEERKKRKRKEEGRGEQRGGVPAVSIRHGIHKGVNM
jgi:hypothetical protein